PGKKVAVVGLGGLGHMAVKIAVAMGAEVTVISRTDRKRDDALKFGAVDLVPDADMKPLRGTFDLIINTVSEGLDIAQYLKLLKPEATLVIVGLPSKPLQIGAGALIMGSRNFAGSNIGGIRETQEMLDFCAEHGIAPEVEMISADEINDAY